MVDKDLKFSVVSTRADGENAELSPALVEALSIYSELKERCSFDLKGMVYVQNPVGFEARDLRGAHGVRTGFTDTYTLCVDTLLTKYPQQLSPERRQALEVGMPKLYEAFCRLGFPDLQNLTPKDGDWFLGMAYIPLNFVHFNDITPQGTKIDLVNDDIEKVCNALQAQIASTRFKNPRERQADAAHVDWLARAREEDDRAFATREANIREVRRTMRVVEGGDE